MNAMCILVRHEEFGYRPITYMEIPAHFHDVKTARICCACVCFLQAISGARDLKHRGLENIVPTAPFKSPFAVLPRYRYLPVTTREEESGWIATGAGYHFHPTVKNASGILYISSQGRK